jgi:hypothetical protein
MFCSDGPRDFTFSSSLPQSSPSPTIMYFGFWKSPKQLPNHFDDFIEAPEAEMPARHLPLSAFSKANDFSTLIRRHTEEL